ncbi:hypothetical protein G7K_2118-t1 [Saitoella complicata NRRL Y-17804]|uniref:Uncharacterized protein n=1 Tax=Saitoella complicata (strain BCRC 22490 / CBS 7301 / JCM 7358 / NBRC 10748 / NRRL Y-17804) TaxID=698492 RepID=A0A0E9NDJ6_SAICN|nr:hypothetical protein G7K_2118-t1 [Saitoella complicata NRRL Y-17804]
MMLPSLQPKRPSIQAPPQSSGPRTQDTSRTHPVFFTQRRLSRSELPVQFDSAKTSPVFYGYKVAKDGEVKL